MASEGAVVPRQEMPVAIPHSGEGYPIAFALLSALLFSYSCILTFQELAWLGAEAGRDTSEQCSGG